MSTRNVKEILLPPRPEVLEALTKFSADEVAKMHPVAVLPWAELAYQAREEGDNVQAYAFSRVGYHRGLDALREVGWAGEGHIPWSHRPNRGFLRCVYVLLKSAKALGDDEEVEHIHAFLRDSSPETIDAIEGNGDGQPPTESIVLRAID